MKRLINKKYIFFSISLGFVIGLNICFRSFPIYFPQLKDQAEEIVKNTITQKIAQEVYSKFPQYDPIAKDRLIKMTSRQYSLSNRQIRKQINDLYTKMKDRFQDDNNQTYLMELDCWHWAKYVENVVYLGHPGDKIIGGKHFDSFMLAPDGNYLLWDNFLFYFSAFLYKIFSIFKFVPLFTFLFYLPLFFIILLIGVLFFFTFRLGKYICAISSCIFVGLFASFIPRSSVGWFDKDILNLFFPILIVFIYLFSYNVHRKLNKLFLIFLSSFFVGLFCFTWLNWWFIFILLIIYEVILIFILLFKQRYKKENKSLLKEHIFSLSFFFLFSIFWIVIFCRLEPFLFIYRQIKETIRLTNPLLASIWPNVYFTVGELKRTTLLEIVKTCGTGNFVFGILSMLVVFIYNVLIKKEDSYKKHLSIVLVFWFISMFYASLKGVRFIVFLSVPLGIFSGWFLYYIFEYFKMKKYYLEGIIIVFFLMGVLMLSHIFRANKVALLIFPLMNDPWYKGLKLIEKTTPKEAILNSWWDFGDWFKVVAKRRVIFDGQSQNTPQAYWMAKALLSNNEEESLVILKMLNNGANKVFEIINEYLQNPLQSVLLLENILLLDTVKAKDILSDFLPIRVIDKIISLIFDKPPPAYFIVDYSMCPKITAISYLGNWNFSKVYIAQNFHTKEKGQILEYLLELGKNKEEIDKLYQEAFLISSKDLNNWLSYPVQFYSGLSRGKEKDDVVVFDNGFIYNKKNRTIYTSNGQIPRSLFFKDNEKIEEVVFSNANLVFSILVFEDKDGWRAVCLDRALGKSLFVKLYFLRGFGLKHFKTHIDIEDADNYIGCYLIDW